jgi:hypothetical protein
MGVFGDLWDAVVGDPPAVARDRVLRLPCAVPTGLQLMRFDRAPGERDTFAVLRVTCPDGSAEVEADLRWLLEAVQNGLPIVGADGTRASGPTPESVLAVMRQAQELTADQLAAEDRQEASQAAQLAHDDALAQQQAAAIENTSYLSLFGNELGSAARGTVAGAFDIGANIVAGALGVSPKTVKTVAIVTAAGAAARALWSFGQTFRRAAA